MGGSTAKVKPLPMLNACPTLADRSVITIWQGKLAMALPDV